MGEELHTGASELEGRYLTFAISRERYGIEILKIQEIIKVTHITAVPRSPKYLKGVLNLRGKIIPVIDLRTRFEITSIPYDEKTCIIVINLRSGEHETSLGIIVDTVLEVVNFSSREIESAPNYGGTLKTQFIKGMGAKDGALIILLDIDKVINTSEGIGTASAA